MKILVVMKNWLGDLLFQMPALELIKAKYPDAEIHCVAPERCREILEAHPAVSGFFSFDEKSTHRAWLKRLSFISELRKAGPWGEGYLFHRSRSRATLLWLAGVKKRIGYGKGRKFLLTKAVAEPAGKLHQLDFFMELMKGAGYEVPAGPVSRFYFKPEDETKALAVLSENKVKPGARYVCFHLGANWEPKRWPAEHFSELADRVHDKWKVPVVVTGSQPDRHLFDRFVQGVRRARVIDLVGKTGLRVSSVIYRNAACLVTGDSGPMHIASGAGARVVALFGPTDPKLTGPRGTGESIVLQYIPPGFSVPFFGKDLPASGWLSRISPEEVFAAVERIYPVRD
jgi:lipopolysaccharide heptosyltransferase II